MTAGISNQTTTTLQQYLLPPLELLHEKDNMKI